MHLRIDGPSPTDFPAGGLLRLAHLSDLHIGKDRVPNPSAAFELFLDRIQAWNPNVIVVSGDLVDTPDDRESMLWVQARLNQTACPWICIPGNHDIRWPDKKSAYDQIFGPVEPVVRLGSVDFLLFDSFRGLSMAERTATELNSESHLSNGKVPRAQLDAAEAALTGAAHRVAIIHHHVIPEPPSLKDGKVFDEEASGTMMALFNHDEFLDWCDGRVRLVLHGHKHAPEPPQEPREGIIVLRGSAPYKLGGMARIVDLLPDAIHTHELVLQETS